MAETNVIEQTDTSTIVKEPVWFKVLLHNDDTTTFDFVIAILMRIFYKKIEEAIEITKSIHDDGQGIAGCPYTKEIADEKVLEVNNFARANGYPLTATSEEL